LVHTRRFRQRVSNGEGAGWNDGGVATYVAFLRGINLGPSTKISMPELRAMAEELGFTDVGTYINSGNLMVSSPKKAATVEREISEAIKKTFGRQIDVTVRTPAQLKKVLADNPYPDGNPSQVAVAFLTAAPAKDAKDRVAAVAADYEPFTFAGQQVYVNYSRGLGRSKLAEKFSDIVGVSSTVRNIRTIEKVVELCS
jgi:uncharacterized protein (DUF1697 family)